MSLNCKSILIGSAQPQALIEFYIKAFDKQPDMTDSDFAGWQIGACFFGVGPHSEVHGQNQEPSRCLVNFETADVQTEFERIKGLGAQVIKEPYQMEGSNMWIATLADPDSNYFQLMSPWEEQSKS